MFCAIYEAITHGEKILDEAARDEAAREEMQKRYLEPDRLQGGSEWRQDKGEYLFNNH